MVYEFITNNFEISPQEVAHIYKLRWQIELLFKKLKQNFQLHFFYSETENGIKAQIRDSQSFFDSPGIGTHTSDQPFGCDVDDNKQP